MIRMKKKILYAAAFVLLAWAAQSCEALDECKICRIVSTDDTTGEVTEGFETEYCGAALIAIEAQKPKTVLGVTSEYVCR